MSNLNSLSTFHKVQVWQLVQFLLGKIEKQAALQKNTGHCLSLEWWQSGFIHTKLQLHYRKKGLKIASKPRFEAHHCKKSLDLSLCSSKQAKKEDFGLWHSKMSEFFLCRDDRSLEILNSTIYKIDNDLYTWRTKGSLRNTKNQQSMICDYAVDDIVQKCFVWMSCCYGDWHVINTERICSLCYNLSVGPGAVLLDGIRVTEQRTCLPAKKVTMEWINNYLRQINKNNN